MKNLSSQYLVRPHNPMRTWLFYTGLLLIIALALWGMFEYGRQRAGFDAADAEAKANDLRAKISQLEAEKEGMRSTNVSLERSSQIDAKARQDVTAKLEALNEEMLELKEELVFYRSLLSPSDQQAGLHIQSFQLVQDAKNGLYSYKLVLTQLRKNDKFARGTVNLLLNGKDENNSPIKFDFKDIIVGENPALSFKFKYFQSLEGSIKLPENLSPEDIQVKVIPYGRRLKSVEQSYVWNAIIAGG